MEKQRNTILLIARSLITIIFIGAGINKIGHYTATVQMMQAVGLNGLFLPAVIVMELVGGLCLLFGLWTRIAALGLALFCIISAPLFHNNFADPIQTAMFLKNIAMAGGLLSLSEAGAGAFSLDSKLRRNTRKHYSAIKTTR